MTEVLETILEIRNLHREFGGIQALRGVNLEIRRGSITGLIGPNGSGKTTLFQIISGIDHQGQGHIIFDGEAILGLRPSSIYHRGLARTFQLSRIFADLTVLENLIVAGHRHDQGVKERAIGLLEKVNLHHYLDVMGNHLSYGQQRLVEFLRVLMCDPALILLDEPAAGVNPTLRQTLWELVRHLNQLGTTFLIIEHDMSVIADLCQKVYVLNEGEIIAHGDFAMIRQDNRVLEAYFGKRKVERHE